MLKLNHLLGMGMKTQSTIVLIAFSILAVAFNFQTVSDNNTNG